ncbi:helix-turn-helix domain-containing protein [Solibacillus silvestris]|uniref:helix-turn-helix domain-containing protein n=1 Tax=Solibacillus silvestris TaxID=76853 RepID=UPI003F7DFCF2
MDRLRNAEITDKVVFLIERHIDSHHCLAKVEAIVLEKYPNYIAVFETQVGMPPDEYMTKVRLHKAEKLLAQTNMDFKEISKAIGMNGYFEFTEVFKRFYGMTPGGYRNQLFK